MFHKSLSTTPKAPSHAEFVALQNQLKTKEDQWKKEKEELTQRVEVAEKSLAETKAKAGEEARIKEELQKRVKELEDETSKITKNINHVDAAPPSCTVVQEVNRRLVEEHQRREELEERYRCLCQQYQRLKSGIEWQEANGGSRGGEGVARQMNEAYNKRVKDSTALSTKMDSLSSRLEDLCLMSESAVLAKTADKLRKGVKYLNK